MPGNALRERVCNETSSSLPPSEKKESLYLLPTSLPIAPSHCVPKRSYKSLREALSEVEEITSIAIERVRNNEVATWGENR